MPAPTYEANTYPPFFSLISILEPSQAFKIALEKAFNEPTIG
jgi:hypothetical protein